ncbi:hypothetical protein PtA15_11A144 [Puccinia triticina]|uniref:DUF2421 domain-containing protein n=1 Tax=Puccinia triticina TaxID=208348 RepID=A0ABY7CZB7_9BASI|nr:uncharacterized protein PtA15_11A144 [Puccinia triticina]WAQ89456.1 hypothetical protein PtA15_11A144 [Puccinia triticina]
MDPAEQHRRQRPASKRPSSSMRRTRRSSAEEDLKQRRLSGWAVFGPAIEQDADDAAHSRLQAAFSKLPSTFRRDFRVILKCSIAYLIASLFSFYDPLSDLLVLPFGLDGPFSGAHVVATIVTYYRPAATVGGMIEANHHAIWGLFWLAVIIGGSIHFGYLDFKKSLIYTEIVLIGMLISNLTCLGFWKGSATDSLQKDINTTLDSFATLVGMLTKTFLLDETIYTDQDRLKQAIDRHDLSFTSLKGSLDAAVYEFFEPRIQRSQHHYRELVASMNRLAQHLTGLRSGCTLQYELLGPIHHHLRARRPTQQDSPPPPPPGGRPIEDVFMAFCEEVGPSLKTLMATGAACLHGIKTPRNNLPVDLEAASDGIDKIVHMRTQLALAIQVFQESHNLAMKNLYHSFISTANPAANLPSSSIPPPSLDHSHSHQLNEEIFVICFFLFNMEEFMRELCHLLDIFVDIRTDEELIQYESRLRWRRLRRRLDPRTWMKKGTYEYAEGRRKPRPRRQRPKLTAVLPLNPKAQRPFGSGEAHKHQDRQGEQNASASVSSLDRPKRALYDFLQKLNDPDAKTAIKIGAGAALMTFPAFWDLTRPTFHHYRAQWAVVTYMIVMASTLGQTNFLVITRMVGTLIGSGVALAAQYAFWQDPVVLPLLGFIFSLPCFWLIVSQPAYASTGRFLLLSYNLVCLYSFNVRDKNASILATAYNRIVCVFVGVLFGWVINSFVWPYKARRELRKCLSEFLLESAFLYSFLVKNYSSKPTGAGDEAEETGAAEGDPNLASEATENSALLLGSHAKAQLKSRVDELSKMEMFLQVKLIRLFGLLSATRHEPRLKGRFPKARYQTMLQGCQLMLDMLHSLRAVTVREEWFEQTVREDFLLAARDEHRELVGNLVLFFGLLSSSIELKAPLPPYLPPAAEARARLLKKISDRLAAAPDHSHPHPEAAKKSPPDAPPSADQPPQPAPPPRPPILARSTTQMTSNNRKINYSLFFAFIVAIKHILIQLELVGAEAQSLFGIIGGIRTLSEFEEIFNSL